jgi:hypothetical protein
MAVASITLQALVEDGQEVDLVVAGGVRIELGVAVVHAVDLGALQDRLGPDLQRPLRRGGVGGEVGHAETGGEDDDPPLLEVPDARRRM